MKIVVKETGGIYFNFPLVDKNMAVSFSLAGNADRFFASYYIICRTFHNQKRRRQKIAQLIPKIKHQQHNADRRRQRGNDHPV